MNYKEEIKTILDEINQSNSSNHKIDVLRKHSDNELLKRVLKMTYDKVTHTYGVTMKNVELIEAEGPHQDLEWALDILEDRLATREVTGNDALDLVALTLSSLNDNDSYIIQKILGRDLRINMGRSNINKVHKGLIVKPPYMRCGLYNEKTQKKINYPCLIQQKADGSFIATTVDNDQVTFTTRSGEEKQYPLLAKEFAGMPDGVYIGEILIHGIRNRAEANGMLNSDTPPHEDIYVQLWDYVTLDEYSRPKDRCNKTAYKDRFKQLQTTIDEAIDIEHIEIIETHTVNSMKEAMTIVLEWMQNGFEGGVIKDFNNIFLDHTSPTQLKIKLVIDADVRCTGFYEGKPGTKRVNTFGGITYETDDGKVKGRTSGFTDKQLIEYNSNRDHYIGQIFTIEFNDITRARDSETYALSHPRFIEFREDKDTTDTFERIQEMKRMAMGLDGTNDD